MRGRILAAGDGGEEGDFGSTGDVFVGGGKFLVHGAADEGGVGEGGCVASAAGL
jgi:hypothetical protein